MQVLQLPANAQLSAATGEVHNHTMAMLNGKRLYGRKGLTFGMFPRWQTTSMRPAVTILNADHPFWQVDNAEDLYAYMEAAFPNVCLASSTPMC